MKKEMYKGMVNSPQTGISQDINESVTDIPVENGSVFPKGPNLAVIGTDQHAETIRYTSVNSNILVGCTRGFEGVAKSWDSGTPIARNITQYDIYSLQENLKEVDSNKVEKVENKSLSTEDYTTEEKEKLGGIEKGANKYTHPVNHSPEIIKETEEKQFISKTEKESIKNKVGKDGNKVLSTNDYTDTDKQEVAKIKNKVDKVSGKGLSTNDFTNNHKSKVDNIPSNPKYTDTITSINGKTGVVTINKGDVGLSNLTNVKQMPISGGNLENYTEKTSTTTGTINLNNGNVFIDTPTSNRNYSFSNAKSGVAHSFTLQINMGSTKRTLRFPTSVKWQDGEIPDMTMTNKTYILTFMTTNGGSTWFGMFGGAF